MVSCFLRCYCFLLWLLFTSISAHAIDKKVNNVTIMRVGFMVDANSPGGGWGFIVSKPGAADCGFGLMRLPPMNTDAGKAMLSLMLSAQATQNKLPEIAYSASATVNAVCQITSAQIDSGA
ncbi:TPA: hypothetical protein SL402_003845 [Pseudomonas aeruginosa]|uniref:hypothetical protein n=7 Tax=Pseudomonas aeruginosa TaxID=287 RepID=UPI00071BFFBC|nr:hypothetical protein [Pseudomonas aeruginosa]KSE96837.1 hypothetical protein AO934_15095 [Pseudomonas aeruginosa]MBG6659242.1 hypothetical protein [Pseudomonas aeruginosa]MBI7814228.1 hypothetical protein [Pseudomonas aeruginosa]MCS9315388.1 hypothetical protein [Pseudomonas aeruginosa]MCT0556260.1 hypothetical protein [Pseudomonas aeruginosa]